jgi:L-glyceraldehyde 3-phosphate reductase
VPADSRAALRWGEEQTSRRITPERLQAVRALNEVAKQRGQSLAQMAIQWILRLPAITSVLIGVSRVEQLEENVRALAGPTFSEEELARIDALAPAA